MNLYAKRDLKLSTRDIIRDDGISQIFFFFFIYENVMKIIN